MDATTKQWLRASEKWVEDMKLVISGNAVEARPLKEQIRIFNKRLKLMDAQNKAYKKSLAYMKEAISSTKKRRS